MNDEQAFMRYIGEPYQRRTLPPPDYARAARERYRAYVDAYREQSWSDMAYLARHCGDNFNAVLTACRDRDIGRPMYSAPALLDYYHRTGGSAMPA